MSSVLDTKPVAGWLSPQVLRWLPVVAGLLALYAPMVYDLNRTLWNDEEHAHGPIVFMIVLWLLWRQREEFLRAPAPATAAASVLGWGMLGFGLLLYIFGRSQSIILFEVGSLIPVTGGLLVITQGFTSLRALWFPLLFMLFLVPLPGVLVDAMTGPLKQHVSVIAENLLYWAGYPIARNGVILTIGQYQLLVADACSGLNSMYSLSAMGLLYLHLMRYPSRLRNGLLLASVLPIAFAANIVRVMVLVLVTYHFGDEAGQGFVHGFAGMVLFVVALLMLFAFDALLGLVPFLRRRSPQ